jgi:hypothetical protein
MSAPLTESLLLTRSGFPSPSMSKVDQRVADAWE